MARFEGTLPYKGRELPVVVERGLGRTRIDVDGRTVVDEKPFVPRANVPFRVGLQKAELLFSNSGLREACMLQVDGVQFQLDYIESDGSVETDEGRRVRMLRTGALGMIGFGIFAGIFGMPSGDRYYPALLGAAPWLVLVGLVMLIVPTQAEAWANRYYASPSWVKFPVMALTLGLVIFLGDLFTGWVLSAYR